VGGPHLQVRLAHVFEQLVAGRELDATDAGHSVDPKTACVGSHFSLKSRSVTKINLEYKR
jgi:hypothetical protein